MKNIQKLQSPQNIITILFVAVLMAISSISFSSCSKGLPMQAEQVGDVQLLEGSSLPMSHVEGIEYPITVSKIFKFKSSENQYRGGTIRMPDGSKFKVPAGALTPPPEIPWGDNVTITMTIDKDYVNNRLIFSFEPSGCQFSPKATIKFSWEGLNDASLPMLYYIDENDDLIPQSPDDVNFNKQLLILKIAHFSRYAVAHS